MTTSGTVAPFAGDSDPVNVYLHVNVMLFGNPVAAVVQPSPPPAGASPPTVKVERGVAGLKPTVASL